MLAKTEVRLDHELSMAGVAVGIGLFVCGVRDFRYGTIVPVRAVFTCDCVSSAEVGQVAASMNDASLFATASSPGTCVKRMGLSDSA